MTDDIEFIVSYPNENGDGMKKEKQVRRKKRTQRVSLDASIAKKKNYVEFDDYKPKPTKPKIAKPNVAKKTTRSKQPSPRPKSNLKNWVVGIGTAAVLGAGILAYKACNRSIDSIAKNVPALTVPTSAEHAMRRTITTIDNAGTPYHVKLFDSSVVALVKQTNIVDLENLAVDKEAVTLSQNVFSQMSIDDIMDATRPTGIFDIYTQWSKYDTVNFEAAMKWMWDYKVHKKMNGRFKEVGDKFVESYSSKTAEKSSLPKIREDVENYATALLNNFDKESFLAPKHTEKQRFINNTTKYIDQDAILSAYSITEIIRGHNPMFSVIFYDKLLQEAGYDFLTRIPAMADRFLSFGEFQLTSYVIHGSKEGSATYFNKFLPKKYQAPGSMKNYNTFEEHTGGAVLNMIKNTQELGNALFVNNSLTKFNDAFEKLSDEEQAALAAGIFCAAHNGTKATAQAMYNWAQTGGTTPVGEMEFSNETVGTYYENSVKNYLLLKEIFE